MLTTHIELTLQQLLQSALGCPQINSIHLSLLQSFFDIILKKLDCQNEKIETEADIGACLREILRASRISPYPFECEQIDIHSNSTESEQKLWKRLENVQTKLQRHYIEIRRCNAALKGRYRTENWGRYASGCENVCARSEKDEAVICKLAQSETFIMKLMATAVIPIIDEMNNMRERVQEKHKQLLDYKKYLSEQNLQIEKLYSKCILCEKFRKDFKKEKEIFSQTMDEINAMMLAKSKRAEGTLMKKYLKQEISILEKELNKLTVELNCRKPGSELKTIAEQQCISCLGPLVCPKVPTIKQPIESCLKQEVPKKRYCSVAGPCISEGGRQYISHVIKLRESKRKEEIQLDRRQTHFEGLLGDYYKRGFSEDDGWTVCE